MKEQDSSPLQQVKSGFWKAIGGTIGAGIVIGLWELLVRYTRIIPGTVIRWVGSLIPQGKAAATISHDLWYLGLFLFFGSFLYVVWRENRYVSRMYAKRDGIESGKIKVLDLTLEELAFLQSHWPEIFRP